MKCYKYISCRYHFYLRINYSVVNCIRLDRFRTGSETAAILSPPAEPLCLYQPPPGDGVKHEAAGHHVSASAYSNYPAYSGMPPPGGLHRAGPPPKPAASASTAGGGGQGAAAVSPSYPRVSSTTQSDSEREGDIGKQTHYFCIIIFHILFSQSIFIDKYSPAWSVFHILPLEQFVAWKF